MQSLMGETTRAKHRYYLLPITQISVQMFCISDMLPCVYRRC
ncbi:hypothetical protein [Moorena producens]|nr:hypothetical protein [Moorena producens]